MRGINNLNSNNLNHHDIHEIFSQITQSLNCVECRASILPHKIRITDIQDNECLFDVDCGKCDTEMSLSARIEKNPNKNAMTYNKSSQIVHDSLVEEGVSEFDVVAVRNELQENFSGSFIEAFAR